jgi:hypothetical protein
LSAAAEASLDTALPILRSIRHALIPAFGNTWEARVQGADAAGHYPAGTVISTGDVNGIGPNFRLETPGQSIRLG